MQENEIPEPHELPNKPLVEAIFELRWKLQKPAPPMPPHDPGFRIALGRYYDMIRKDYPVMVDLPSSQVPEDMTAYTVRHQFRVAEDKWPLTQLGPGILTINETEGYTWDAFDSRLKAVVKAIYSAYPSDIHPFTPILIQLRYIDAFEFNPEKLDPVAFIRDSLHTEISIDPLVAKSQPDLAAPSRLRLNLTFPLSKPKGVGIMTFASGLHHDKPAIILETIIRSEGDDSPQEEKDISTWIADAHVVVDKWFFTLCRGELMERFERQNEHADTQQN